MSSFADAIKVADHEYALERAERHRLEDLDRQKPLTILQLGHDVEFWENQIDLTKNQVESVTENAVGETPSYAKHLRSSKKKVHKDTKRHLRKARKALHRAMTKQHLDTSDDHIEEASCTHRLPTPPRRLSSLTDQSGSSGVHGAVAFLAVPPGLASKP
jgi:hypothetical protein